MVTFQQRFGLRNKGRWEERLKTIQALYEYARPGKSRVPHGSRFVVEVHYAAKQSQLSDLRIQQEARYWSNDAHGWKEHHPESVLLHSQPEGPEERCILRSTGSRLTVNHLNGSRRTSQESRFHKIRRTDRSASEVCISQCFYYYYYIST